MFPNRILTMAGSDQCCFITYIGNICPTESRSLTGEQIQINTFVQF